MSDTIEVLWQNEHMVAINKPAGVATQAPAQFPSVESKLRVQLARAEAYLAFPHRLDRLVSGVLLVALTKRAARLLSAQFESRKTAKHYRAVVHGVIDGEHRWEDWLRKVSGQPRAEVCASERPDAKPAITLVRGFGTQPKANRSALELSPVTGRMHQLRVQAASRGLPIVGDTLYGAQAADERARILLHASCLEFHDPGSGKRTVVEAQCPFEWPER
ncbi:MAG: RluA family pseudouridine synthase [Planctomycetota bacterium]